MLINYIIALIITFVILSLLKNKHPYYFKNISTKDLVIASLIWPAFWILVLIIIINITIEKFK